MTKKFLLLLLALPLLLAGCTKTATPEAKTSLLDNKTIIFYGDTCPHCKILEQYLEDNKINDRMTMEKMEIYKNADNAKLMMEAVSRCGLSQSNVGVPFLWTENKCYVGGDEATAFFKAKFKL
ncbi:MAG: hypothetical protein WCJ57_03155 [Candidatus Falkowbacteria bacterium]